jgi:hypothetical protein
MLLTCALASCRETGHLSFVSTHVANSWAAGATTTPVAEVSAVPTCGLASSVTPSRSWRPIYSLTWEFAPFSQFMLARFPDFVGGFGVPLSGNCTSTEPFMIIRQLNLGNVIYRWESQVLMRTGHLLGHIPEKWPDHLRPDSAARRHSRGRRPPRSVIRSFRSFILSVVH